MKNEFTKGEWIYQESICPITGIDGEIEISSSDNKVTEWIALCHEESNAKLIAAAPEMLEALLEYKRLYESVEPAGGWHGVYEFGNMAIKKATNQ